MSPRCHIWSLGTLPTAPGRAVRGSQSLGQRAPQALPLGERQRQGASRLGCGFHAGDLVRGRPCCQSPLCVVKDGGVWGTQGANEPGLGLALACALEMERPPGLQLGGLMEWWGRVGTGP